MTRSTLLLLSVLASAPVLLTGQQEKSHSYAPERGFVPDSATAIRIAEAIWIPIYGQAQIENERPFTATLKDDVWTVTGSLKAAPGHVAKGGVALVRSGRRTVAFFA